MALVTYWWIQLCSDSRQLGKNTIHVKPISPLLRNSSPSLNSLIVYSIFWTRTKWIPRLSQGGNDLIFVCRKCFCCSNLLVIVFWLIDNDIDHVASKDHTKIKTMQEGHWSVQNNNDKFIIFLFLLSKNKISYEFVFSFVFISGGEHLSTEKPYHSLSPSIQKIEEIKKFWTISKFSNSNLKFKFRVTSQQHLTTGYHSQLLFHWQDIELWDSAENNCSAQLPCSGRTGFALNNRKLSEQQNIFSKFGISSSLNLVHQQHYQQKWSLLLGKRFKI